MISFSRPLSQFVNLTRVTCWVYWLQLSHNSGTTSTLTTLHDALPPLSRSQYDPEFNGTPGWHVWHPLHPSARWRCRVHRLTPPYIHLDVEHGRRGTTTWPSAQIQPGCCLERSFHGIGGFYVAIRPTGELRKLFYFLTLWQWPNVGLSYSPSISNTLHSI